MIRALSSRAEKEAAKAEKAIAAFSALDALGPSALSRGGDAW